MASISKLSILVLTSLFLLLFEPGRGLAAANFVTGVYSPFIAVSTGFLWSAEPLLNVIKHLNNMTGDYALSLVLLAVLITLLVLPYHWTVVRNVVLARQMYPKLRDIEQLYGAVILRDKSISEIQFRTLRQNGVNPLIAYLGIPFRIFVFFTLLRAFSPPAEFGEEAFSALITNVALPDKYYIFPLAIFVLTYLRQNVEGMQTGILIPLGSALVYGGLPVGMSIYTIARMCLMLSFSKVSERFLARV